MIGVFGKPVVAAAAYLLLAALLTCKHKRFVATFVQLRSCSCYSDYIASMLQLLLQQAAPNRIKSRRRGHLEGEELYLFLVFNF